MADARGLRGAVLVVALLLALAHGLYVRIILVRVPIGAYFLVATALFFAGGIVAFLASGMLFRIANFGLILLAIIDNLLIIYTRTFPNIFFGRIVPWSMGWNPPGTVQFFVGQLVMIFLSGLLLFKVKSVGASMPK
jgi:hypothetical protein